jgi:mono/diheme cytochrome c family protein
MKRLLLLSLFSLAVGTACNRHKYPFNQTLPATADVQEGEKLYMQYCQKCHPDGEGGLGPSIFYLPGFAKKFQVRHGLGVMPDFDENVISDAELNKIVAYLKALD